MMKTYLQDFTTICEIEPDGNNHVIVTDVNELQFTLTTNLSRRYKHLLSCDRFPFSCYTGIKQDSTRHINPLHLSVVTRYLIKKQISWICKVSVSFILF